MAKERCSIDQSFAPSLSFTDEKHESRETLFVHSTRKKEKVNDERVFVLSSAIDFCLLFIFVLQND